MIIEKLKNLATEKLDVQAECLLKMMIRLRFKNK